MQCIFRPLDAITRDFIVFLLLFLCTVCSIQAKDYQVEVLVFENNTPQPAFESQHYSPPLDPESPAETWTVTPSLLLEEAKSLAESPDYELIHYLSWGQESLPLSESAAYHVLEPNVNGWIKVYANQLLFANLDLEYDGYRMNEKRRLKLDEKHFFDHPKFGVLMQVSRLPEKEENPDEAQLTETP